MRPESVNLKEFEARPFRLQGGSSNSVPSPRPNFEFKESGPTTGAMAISARAVTDPRVRAGSVADSGYLRSASTVFCLFMARGRVNLEIQMQQIERLRAEMSAKAPADRTTTTRAVARIIEDVHLEGRMGKFTVEADEPLARGGTEKGPSPLQYLMVGTAF